MTLIGPNFCEVGTNVEFRLVYEKTYKNLFFTVTYPNDEEHFPNVTGINDSNSRVISFTLSAIGIYKINVFKNKMNNLLVSGNCFAFNLGKERWYTDPIYWSLEKVHLIMEMRMNHPIVNYIEAQAHLLSIITNSVNPHVVIKCDTKISTKKDCEFSFVPPQFGSYEIRFFCNSVSTSEPRPQVHVINSIKWKLVHSFTTDKCLTSLRQKASFIFELYGAPSEFLRAWVECPDHTTVNMFLYGEEKNNKIGQLRCDFTPNVIGLHSLVACYQDAMFDKCPLEFHVYDDNMVEIVEICPDIHSKVKPTVGETLTITYNCLHSDSGHVDIEAIASEDSGIYSPVPVEKLVKDNEGMVTFSIKLSLAGQYLIEGFYNKEKINSFEVEVSLPLQNNNSDYENFDGIKVEDSPNLTDIEPKPKDLISEETEEKLSNLDLVKKDNENFVSIIPSVSGRGLIDAEVGQCAVFIFDPCGVNGKLTVDVIGPRSLTKCLIKPESAHGRYDVEYYPNEIGLYQITILWDEHPINGSPFQVEATDPTSIQCISHQDIFDNIMYISPDRKIKIEFSYSLAGNGRMSARIIKTENDIVIKSWTTLTKTIWTFWIKSTDEGIFKVEVLWNNRTLGIINVKSEYQNDLSPEVVEDPASQIILKGRGLKGALVGETAKFVVETFNIDEGNLALILINRELESETIPINVEEISSGTFECHYFATSPGDYLLHVAWSDNIVQGSPFPIKILKKEPSSQVICRGDGLHYGIVGELSTIYIDVSEVCSYESDQFNSKNDVITVSCIGPDDELANCNIFKESDCQYNVDLQAVVSGRHQLNILYGGLHVPGSPYQSFFTDRQYLEKINVFGPGLQSSQLDGFDSYFIVDTSQAGIGKLRVQVKGPREAFRVEVQKTPTDSRLIKCSYDPTEIGEYTISINWSGCPIKGSPFQIILD